MEPSENFPFVSRFLIIKRNKQDIIKNLNKSKWGTKVMCPPFFYTVHTKGISFAITAAASAELACILSDKRCC